jgi:hypothetical protein
MQSHQQADFIKIQSNHLQYIYPASQHETDVHKGLPTVRTGINGSKVDTSDLLKEGDEISQECE